MTGPLRGSAGERTLVGFTYLFPTATASRGLVTTSALHCALNQEKTCSTPWTELPLII